MILKHFKFRGLAFAALLAFVLVPAGQALVQNAKAEAVTGGLSATAEQREAAEEIVDRLEHHYRDLPLNDELSRRVWARYLDDLDPNRSYFLASDIEEFERFRDALDDELDDGELSAGFAIFNRYQQRVNERLEYVLGRLEDGLDGLSFRDEEEVLLDRSEAPWAEDRKALRDLWRRHLENAVLSMRLNGLEDEEILDRLKRRYEAQKNRMAQNTAEDVFQVYINSLTRIYDPHTNYFTPHRSENFDISMSRSLEGIGAVLQAEDQYTKVIRLVPGGPASKGGQLKPADRIVGVAQGKDGKMVNVIGLRLDEVVNQIRGPKGTLVRLEIIPAGTVSEHDTREITIERNRVILEEQAAKKKILTLGEGPATHRIGVIEIPAFYMDFSAARRGDPNYMSITRDVATLLVELQEDDVDGLIIDLRHNAGGFLGEAIRLVSLFINDGPTVQVREVGNNVETHSDQFPGMLYAGPMAVLVNRDSASAAEIFAGAMQDYGRALIVGDQTFGKGTVQTVLDLSHGKLKMTHAKFYRVTGSSSQHRGIIPDIEMPFLVDKTEIGESAMPNALPWDVIESADYEPVTDLEPYFGELRSRHQARIKDDPEFVYVRRQLELMKENRNQNAVSLKQEVRKASQAERDKKRLEIENFLRRARGEEPVESIKELNALQERRALGAETGDQEDDREDPYLRETGSVLSDFIELLDSERVAASS